MTLKNGLKGLIEIRSNSNLNFLGYFNIFEEKENFYTGDVLYIRVATRSLSAESSAGEELLRVEKGVWKLMKNAPVNLIPIAKSDYPIYMHIHENLDKFIEKEWRK